MTFTISKTNTGYDAHYQDGFGTVVTTGDDKIQLAANTLEAYNLHAQENGLEQIKAEDIKFIEYAK